jgi:hypothetical protein
MLIRQNATVASVIRAVAADLLGAAARTALVRNAERGQRAVVIRSLLRGPSIIAEGAVLLACGVASCILVIAVISCPCIHPAM